MAQVTVELMKLLTIPKFRLFDFDYVFDDLTFKAKLEQYITDYFYEYEVAGDTVEAFKHKFRTRYQRIIPYYNSLYNTTLLSYNPLINNKSTESGIALADTKNNGSVISINSGSDTNATTNNSNTKKSDYPQQQILGGDFLSGEDITNGGSTNTFNAGTKNDNTNNSNSILNNEYEKTVEGISGTTYPELIKQHRATILRIQEDIIKEMKPCFILIY